jgi:hypothetical protein
MPVVIPQKTGEKNMKTVETWVSQRVKQLVKNKQAFIGKEIKYQTERKATILDIKQEGNCLSIFCSKSYLCLPLEEIISIGVSDTMFTIGSTYRFQCSCD